LRALRSIPNYHSGDMKSGRSIWLRNRVGA